MIRGVPEKRTTHTRHLWNMSPGAILCSSTYDTVQDVPIVTLTPETLVEMLAAPTLGVGRGRMGGLIRVTAR